MNFEDTGELPVLKAPIKIVLPKDDDGHVYMTDVEVARIAEQAAEKAVRKFRRVIYEEVGKSAIKWMAYAFGMVIIGLFVWLSSKNDIPK